MTPERWTQIDHLLAKALELPVAERAPYLAAACGEDTDMRREVESLLVAHTEAETDFLSRPAVETVLREIAAEQRQSLVGTMFGNYRLLSILGIGGMGEVYLARDERLGRQLALKILPPQYVEDAARVERFAREARAVSALNHPNIVTVYDIGQLDGTHFIAMEHVDGQTLREKVLAIPDGKLDAKEVVEIALQVSAALAAAHEAGIIHRDIKPENLMVRKDDYVKVVDFGLVKLTEKHHPSGKTQGDDCDPAATNPGMVLGTVRYMSPEQALGREVDARSDIFSLGVVLYELLAGSPPFKGISSAAILDAVVHHSPLPLRQVRPDLSAEFERIVVRMLEKDKNSRFQSAEDVRSALKQVKRELDSSSANLPVVQRINYSGDSQARKDAVPPSGARWKWPWAAVAVVLLFLSALAFAAWRFWPERNLEPSPWLSAYSSQLTDFPGEERDPSLSPDGKMVYYSRRVRGQWDVFWQRVGGSKATNLTEDNDADDTQPACSPDGASVVFRSERNGGGLFVMEATGENVRQISNFGHNPSWSPDSRHIVCGTDYILDPKQRGPKSRVVIISVADGKERVLVDGDDAAQPRWSPGGQRIAFYRRSAANRRNIWTIAADGSDPRPVTESEAVDWNPVWSADGKYLFFASDRKAIASLWRVRIDEASGRALGQPEPVTGPTAEVMQMDLARDGRRIVYATRVQDANLKVIGFDAFKLATIGEAAAVTAGTRPSGSPNVSPDGQWVAFHSMGGAREDIWLTRADGAGTPINLTNDEPIDRAPRWSPDGKRLAFFSSRSGLSQIWLMNADGSGKRQLTFTETGCNFPFWSPDGRHIAYQLTNSVGAGNEQVGSRLPRGTQIIEVDTPWDQQTPVTLSSNDSDEWFSGHAWSPDGKLLAGRAARVQGQEVLIKPGLFVYSFESGRYEQVTNFGTRPEWLGDSRHIIFPYSGKGKMAEQQVWAVDIKTRAVKPLLSHPSGLISTLGLSQDNCRLFFTMTAHQADIFLLSLDK